MTTSTWYILCGIGAVLLHGLSIRGVSKIPKFHGPEWFFDVHVGAEFYHGPGRQMTQEYRNLVIRSFLFEAALFSIAAIVFRSHGILALAVLACVAIAVSIYQHRVARRFAR